LSDVISFAEEVIGALDVNGDGEVSKEEYMDLLENDPVLFETFTELLTVTVSVCFPSTLLCLSAFVITASVCGTACHV